MIDAGCEYLVTLHSAGMRIAAYAALTCAYAWFWSRHQRRDYWMWFTLHWTLTLVAETILWGVWFYRKAHGHGYDVYYPTSIMFYVANTTATIALIMAAYKLADKSVPWFWWGLYTVPLLAVTVKAAGEMTVWASAVHGWSYNFFEYLGPGVAYTLIAFFTARWWMPSVLRIVTLILGMLWFTQDMLWSRACLAGLMPVNLSNITGAFLAVMLGLLFLMLHLTRVETEREAALARVVEMERAMRAAVEVTADSLLQEATEDELNIHRLARHASGPNGRHDAGGTPPIPGRKEPTRGIAC